MLPLRILLVSSSVLLMHCISLVHPLDVNASGQASSNGSNDNNSSSSRSSTFNEQRLLKWQTRLVEISGDDYWPVCTCDRTADQCDVDCCCDANCSQMDKYAFSRCRPVAASGEPVYFCRSTRHIFDRKKFHSARQSSRLLCISKDNTGKKQLFANKKTIIESGKLQIQTKHYFKWAANNHSNWFTDQAGRQNVNVDQVKSMLEYKSGSTIIRTHMETTTNGSTHWLDQWRLPGALNSRQGQCNHLQIVNYMQPFSSACLLPLQQPIAVTCTADEQLDVETYHKAIRFYYYDFLKEDYQTVAVQVEGKYSKPNYDQAKGTCLNAVATVEYTVLHRGIYGISQVNLRVRQVELTNLTHAIKQKFVVHFKWADSNATSESLSGNSGYTREQGLVFAQRIGNESYARVKKHLVSSHRLGLCDEHNKLASNWFRFGVNQFSSCRLRISKPTITRQQICASLEAELAKYLDSNLSNLLVSTFGNSSGAYNDTDQWAPVLELDSASSAELSALGCDQLARGTSWQIFYAKVGAKEQPQLKIVGATVRRHPLQLDLKTKCTVNMANSKCSLALDTELFSLVDFIDVTEPLRPDYAPAPSVRIELPSDFFYPFHSSSSVPTTAIINLSTLSLTLLAIFILQI